MDSSLAWYWLLLTTCEENYTHMKEHIHIQFGDVTIYQYSVTFTAANTIYLMRDIDILHICVQEKSFLLKKTVHERK